MQIQISFDGFLSIRTTVQNLAKVLSYEDAEIILKLLNCRIYGCKSIVSNQNGICYCVEVIQ